MIVILHGWSDDSRSFKKIGNFLRGRGLEGIADLYLGDYVSMDDDVTYDDIIHAMEKAWQDKQLPKAPRSVDVVVHSTGGLVIRDWMTRFYSPDNNPIRRLLFLAPANFGSPLAHKGNAMLGRVTKGFTSKKLFQTGRHILHGLELGSEYSWQLAFRDLFAGPEWYGEGKVLATVLVGNHGYTGIAAVANEHGTDGTVRVSTANLNAEYMRWDFASDPQHPSHEAWPSMGQVAFARLNDENHSTVAMKDGGFRNPARTGELIIRGLQVSDAAFVQHCRELETLAEQERAVARRLRSYDERKFRSGYQNTVIHVLDDLGHDVGDYFIELFAKNASGRPDNLLTAKIQRQVLTTVHAYGPNNAYRSLLIDTDALNSLLVEKERDLYISLTAFPQLPKNGNVGYKTVEYDDVGSIHIRPGEIPLLIKPDRTLLIDIVIKRYNDAVFSFKPLPA